MPYLILTIKLTKSYHKASRRGKMSKNDLNSLPVVEESPLQPTNIQFPRRLFGKKNSKKRSFQQAWYKSYPWLQYDSFKDVCFRHTCVKALKEIKIQPNGNIEFAFTSKGFYNWKDAKVAFRNHEDSTIHRKSVEMLHTLPRRPRISDFIRKLRQ